MPTLSTILILYRAVIHSQGSRMFCLNDLFFRQANPYIWCTLIGSWHRGNKCILICKKKNTWWFRMFEILQNRIKNCTLKCKFQTGLNAASAVIFKYKRM